MKANSNIAIDTRKHGRKRSSKICRGHEHVACCQAIFFLPLELGMAE